MDNRLPLPSPRTFPPGQDSIRDAYRDRSPSQKVVPISSHRDWRSAYRTADVTDLMRTLNEALVLVQSGPVLNLSDEHITVALMIEYVRRCLQEAAPLRLSYLLLQARSERAVLCLRLALLELVHLGAVLLQSERYCTEILITSNPSLS